jgi:hypothetical protein
MVMTTPTPTYPGMLPDPAAIQSHLHALSERQRLLRRLLRLAVAARRLPPVAADAPALAPRPHAPATPTPAH